ncbi:MAG: PAS domain S-box protein [Candidatus Heimdallarchaeota archaeon]|nr:MAG: PAS domain S-box protein [Candidatus Heimdallarchaeota archaeon]
MFDELTLDFFIAIYSLLTVTIFTTISIKRKQLYSWLPALLSYIIGTFCILFRFQDPIFRLFGNLFYLTSIFLFVAIIYCDFLNLKSDNLDKRNFSVLGLSVIGSFFVFSMIPLVSFIIRIQIFILILVVIAMVLFLRVYLIKKTPTHAFMFLTSISTTFTSFTTLGSFFYPFIFWEFSYLGNIVFVTLILATSFVALLEDRLKKSENKYRKAFEELQTSEIRYKTLYQTARVGLISTDLEGTILTVNEAAVKLFGYKTIPEVIGKNVSDHFENPQECEDLRLQLLENGFADNLEILMKKQDGTRIILEVGSNLYKDENMDKIRIETVLRDVTEYKETEKIRKALEDKRESFISLTQHELRTPLTIGLGWCDYLLKKQKGHFGKDNEEIVQKIKKSLVRLERLIDNVRTTEQLEHNIFQLDMKKIEFCGFITEIFKYYQHYLGDTFQFKGCPDYKITVEGDKARLRQVIENIMDNAIKHTPKDNRRIRAEITTHPNSLHLSIRDNGAGIQLEHLDEIFNKYFSVPTEYSVVGTGLGLYLVREILKNHKGSIIADSKGRGQGSTFTITLPCKI